MNKKLVSLVLSGLIVLNNTGSLENIYADSDKKPKELINNEDTKSKRVVYLQDGEGDLDQGDGSADKPYQNIRTALKNIQDGETLKLVGNVSYHYYEAGSEGDALPLFINKNITIDGEGGASLYVRAPIQLGADVTFKNLRLEMIPQYTLGRILGQFIERSTTIYAAGHELTLDNVNTKFGSNPEQYNQRPYISGGAYKKYNITGSKSVINIINSNEETKFSGIYAGDYYADRTLDVDINIDGKAKVTDNKIYTGGYNHDLNGTVNINLSAADSNNKANYITKFDKTNHNGDINVNLNKDAFVYNFDATNIKNLTLEESSKIILSEDTNFDVNNVVLRNDATIDFTQMTNNNPIVKGNFDGEATIDDSRKGGIILLGSNQMLEIEGKLTGTTRLSHSNVDMFEDGRVYIKTYGISDGTFILEDNISSEYELKSVQNGNGIDWTIELYKEDFGSFEWIGDNKIEPIGEGSGFGEGIFKIEFTNANGDKYVPFYELYTDFEYTLTVLDENGNEEVINLDTENEIGIDFYISSDYPDVELAVFVSNMNTLKNKKIILKATHIETQKSISKEIYNDIKAPETPEIPETPDNNPDTGVDTPEIPDSNPDTGVDTPEIPDSNPDTGVDTPEIPDSNPDTGVDTPEIPDNNPDTGVDTPEIPDNNPDTGVDTSKPEQSIIEEESNNNSSNNTNNDNSNSSSNNENNNLDDSSDEANKEESPKTYDGGIGSYILSGISSIGLLSILNKKKKRRK